MHGRAKHSHKISLHNGMPLHYFVHCGDTTKANAKIIEQNHCTEASWAAQQKGEAWLLPQVGWQRSINQNGYEAQATRETSVVREDTFDSIPEKPHAIVPPCPFSPRDE